MSFDFKICGFLNIFVYYVEASSAIIKETFCDEKALFAINFVYCNSFNSQFT